MLLFSGDRGLHKHWRLNGAIRRYPEAFKHIPRKHKTPNSPVYWLEQAKTTIKKLGYVPPRKWWYKNKMGQVPRFKNQYPKMFTLIDILTHKQTVINHHRQILQATAKRGLPVTWLTEHGHRDTYNAWHNNRHLYSGIKIETGIEAFKKRTAKRYIYCVMKITRRLGYTPSKQWFVKHHRGLSSYMYRNPQVFARFSFRVAADDRREDVIKKHQQTAKKLAAKNGGVIPYSAWLCTNGHAGLVWAINRFPRRFRGMRIKKCVGRSPIPRFADVKI